jgi:serine/threonine-protein kinase
MQAPENDFLPPGRYQTLARIGHGGMAEVLLAASGSGGVVKLAVLKCLWPELAEDADFTEMFVDEARLCARLSHPNVVQTHEVVEHEGRLALAMEYLEGQPLRSVLARLHGTAAFSLPTRLRVITSVLAGLEYAHELRDFDGTPLELVHRDVSPHNVIVTYDGHVKLIDFGVAKSLAASHQTRPGAVKGKLAYLAPEALRGERADRRADVFSVGVMLWEMLAGRRLWGRKSDSVSGAWRLAAGVPAPPLPEDVDVPRSLRVILTRALALDPNARFQTAAELAAALESVGVDGSASHAARLGRLVSDAFAPEREARRALIERHVRPPADAYHTIEVTSLEPAAPPAPDPLESSVSAQTRATERVRGARTSIAQAFALTSVALAVGVLVGHGVIPWPSPPPATPSPAVAAAPSPPVEPVPAPTTNLEPTAPPLPAEPRDEHAALAREHREHHPHRARRLDLASDDVLGLDGEPLASSAAPSQSRHD